MSRILFTSALAIGALLSTSVTATATEPTAGFTMTLAGKGTASEAATSAEDIELTGGRGFRVGGWGWGGGWRVGWGGGWAGWGWRGWNTGWGWNRWNAGWGWNRWNAGWGWNRWNAGWGWGWNRWSPAWGWGVRPVVVSSFTPVWGWDPCWNGGWGSNTGIGGRIIRISGSADDWNAPAMNLNEVVVRAANTDGTFLYDGGPTNPIPRPIPDAGSSVQPVTLPTGLPVSFKKEANPTGPFRYKAYGEK